MEQEIWKNIRQYPNYEISNTGKIRNKKFKRFLHPTTTVKGYKQVELFRNGIGKTILLHRIIAKEFVCGYKKNLFINHIDGNKTNNLPENLEWVTLAENNTHAWKTGLRKEFGENSNLSRLKKEQVMNIRKEYVPYHGSYADLGRKYGITPEHVSNIIRKKLWKRL